jgi:hypothetical protein
MIIFNPSPLKKVENIHLFVVLSYIISIVSLVNITLLPIEAIVDREKGITVAGCVVTETSKQAPLDSPTELTYLVRMDNGSLVYVSYTAYPPSPYGDTQRASIKLNFINGTILPGNYVTAHGNYDLGTNTVNISSKGDFIVTSINDICLKR